jgi:glycerol-3-phosphate acyltransferase PlsY
MSPLTFISLCVLSYLIGAIPFGVLIARARGIDIRTQGSGNIGATNVGRVIGRKWGLVCLVLDILKGLTPALLASRFVDRDAPTSMILSQWLIIAILAVVGHLFPIYVRFKGGKGVATTIGVALGIFPYFTWPMLAAVACYAVVRLTSGIVSLGSLVIAVAFPIAFAVYVAISAPITMSVFWPLQVVSALLGLAIIVRHRSNIARLLSGRELAVRSPASSSEQQS